MESVESPRTPRTAHRAPTEQILSDTPKPPMQPGLAPYPPQDRWGDWTELESRSWPRRDERHYALVPTTCFNCESACGLLAYVDKQTEEIRKFEGNPLHP